MSKDIFVDCQNTLWLKGNTELNRGLVAALDCAAEAGYHIIFLSGGRLATYDKLFYDHRDQFPESLTCHRFPVLNSKYDARGATLAILIDDTPLGELTATYGFKAQSFIDAKNKTDATYFKEELEKILGPLPPLREDRVASAGTPEPRP